MTARRQRLFMVIFTIFGVSLTTILVINAFRQNMLFFFTPQQIAAEAPKDRNFRLGGLVEKGSLTREDDGLTVHFLVTDTVKNIQVTYKGILPDLFREGQGIVAMGRLLHDGSFLAEEVLAKHDENYTPPEVSSAIKAAVQSSNIPSIP
ncbi:Cytochrome c-type biogenesis protein CcmE [Gammaproteobacteria bacterium]